MNTAACIICLSTLHAAEASTYACQRCTDRVDGHLRAIGGPSGLYVQLSTRLAPGSTGGGPAVSGGGATAPVPVRLDVLNLMTAGGPVLGPLEGWVQDWATHGRARVCAGGTLQQRVDHAVSTLRFNLRWASERHPAVDEFAREIGSIHRALTARITGERPVRTVPVACPCGTVLRVGLDTPGARCRGCGEQYGHAEVLRLPLAGRQVAA
ncbi:hypothetical protein ACWCWD_06460 [Streptomyces sp. NPDC001493]